MNKTKGCLIANFATVPAEMKRDGQWARAQLQARDRAEIALPLELPIWVTKTPLTEGKA
ncbi:hypothetical protein [Klebsiella pneumoniae]|uniref:hypothetical protein n=1 Tax=Klebsiella pneumoniae TaxID=573 RepID=UPI001617F05C|nr:hypothetical protein [Klebsiella pneumoniae]